MYKFIFELKNNLKKIFIIFITGLLLNGIGLGITFLELSKFDFNYKKYDNNITLKTNINNNNIYFENLEYYNDINKVVIDNNIKDIEIDIEYTKFIKPYINTNTNYYYIDYTSTNYNVVKYILNDIKNKKVNFNNYYDYNIKQIRISQTNYNLLIEDND